MTKYGGFVQGGASPGTPSGFVLDVQGSATGTPMPVDTELSTAAALTSDGIAGPTAGSVGALGYVASQTVAGQWNRLREAPTIDSSAGTGLVATAGLLWDPNLGAWVRARDAAPTAAAVSGLGLFPAAGMSYDPGTGLWSRWSHPISDSVIVDNYNGVVPMLHNPQSGSFDRAKAIRPIDGVAEAGVQAVMGLIYNPTTTGYDRPKAPQADGFAFAGMPGNIPLMLNPALTLDRLRGDATNGLRVEPSPTTLAQVTSGAPNAAGTITLPAAGVGLFHYIDHIRVSRVATAALAGAALLAITTTNLGGRGWRVGNAMVAGGTSIDVEEIFTHAIKSAVANTATTVVFPAPGAAVSWDITVDYHIGP